jgi:Recombinase
VPPVGLVYRNDRTIGLDPDLQVQNAIPLVFDTFERTGSAMQTVRFFREQGLLFPRRLRTGPNKGDLLWAAPHHARVLQVLHNPRYAGAFAYGRTRIRRRHDGGTSVIKVARPDWQFVIPSMHQATSTGSASRPTSGGSPTTLALSVGSGGRGRHVRDRRYSKVVCSVACAASAWACTTAKSTAAQSQPISARRTRYAARDGPAKRCPGSSSAQKSSAAS